MVPLITDLTIGLEAAQGACATAIDRASELRISVCVAVVDRAGHLVLYARMDGAPLASAALAQDKAWTAAAFDAATHVLWEQIHETPALVHGVAKNDRVSVIGGGAPISVDGQVVGAVGISGGTPEQDQLVAEAAAAAFA